MVNYSDLIIWIVWSYLEIVSTLFWDGLRELQVTPLDKGGIIDKVSVKRVESLGFNSFR